MQTACLKGAKGGSEANREYSWRRKTKIVRRTKNGSVEPYSPSHLPAVIER